MSADKSRVWQRCSAGRIRATSTPFLQPLHTKAWAGRLLRSHPHARNPICPRILATSFCRDSDLANSGDSRIRTRVCAPDYSRILGLLEFFAREGTFALPVFSSNTNADRQEIVNVPSVE